MHLIWTLVLLIHTRICYGELFKCVVPKFERSNVNVMNSPNHEDRTKRSVNNLRIKLSYDKSFKRTEQFKLSVMEPAVRFWEKAIKPKNPSTRPLLLERYCQESYRHTKTGKQICVSRCETPTCNYLQIPDEFLDPCRKENSTGSIIETGPNSSGAANTDLVIMVSERPCDKGVSAYASYCYQQPIDNRPIFGIINTCPGMMNGGDTSHYINIIKHEIMHILAFNAGLFPYYRNKNGSTVNYIKYENISYKYPTGIVHTLVPIFTGPATVREARRFYQCNEIKGVFLEEQKSHFEKRIFQREMMTSITAGGAMFSRFTFTLLEDSGWYDVNYNLTDNFTTGQNKGCNFIFKSCYEYMESKTATSSSVDPYCKTHYRHKLCSKDRKRLLECDLVYNREEKIGPQHRYFSNNLVSFESASDHCPYIMNYKSCLFNNERKNRIFSEYYGNGSKCIRVVSQRKKIYIDAYLNIDNTAGCFKVVCDKTYRNSFLIKIGYNHARCYRPAQTILGGLLVRGFTVKVILECPPCHDVCPESRCTI